IALEDGDGHVVRRSKVGEPGVGQGDGGRGISTVSLKGSRSQTQGAAIAVDDFPDGELEGGVIQRVAQVTAVTGEQFAKFLQDKGIAGEVSRASDVSEGAVVDAEIHPSVDVDTERVESYPPIGDTEHAGVTGLHST